MPETQKITVYFERMTETLGVNGAARLHKALLHGPITPQLRKQVRKFAATSQPRQRMN